MQSDRSSTLHTTLSPTPHTTHNKGGHPAKDGRPLWLIITALHIQQHGIGYYPQQDGELKEMVAVEKLCRIARLAVDVC